MKTILEMTSGSYLYGTNTNQSDKDYLGIFIPDIEYILGFKRVEELDLSKKSKLDNNKNSSEAIDKKLYEIRKFMMLALDNNPNILEMLFVNNDNINFINDIGEQLLDKRFLFLHRGLKQKFLGYAFSQKHKMIIKKDNYFDLLQALSYLQKLDEKKTILEVVLQNNCPHFIKKIIQTDSGNIHIAIGDVTFPPARQIKNVCNSLEERINKTGNREELLLKYGFDTKFASHLVRLMLEGIELLETGNLIFPLKERLTLLDIKNGKWPIKQILDYSEYLENKIENIETISPLSKKPDFESIQNFLMTTLKDVVYEHYKSKS